MSNTIKALLSASTLALALSGSAFAQDKSIKIGVLNDQSGLYRDVNGPGSVVCVRQAVADSGIRRAGFRRGVLRSGRQ